MIERLARHQVESALTRFPVVALIGPRQVGKTTLAHEIAGGTTKYVVHLDLERPSHAARLADAELYLEQHQDALVVLDEVQRMPELFPILRALVDAHRVPGRFLLLGSASPDLVRGASESLAGRIRYVELTPLTLEEVGRTRDNVHRLWLRGGYPDSFLAESDEASMEWRRAFVRTFLERDVPALGLKLAAESLRRFWRMVAHRHGQLWNASELGRSLGVSPPTVVRYLDVLVGTYLARRLEPLPANLGKRLVKSPKVYLRDSGLLHALLDIPDLDALYGHPVVGASWEGFLVEQVLAMTPHDDACFYRTAAGAEVDLLVRSGADAWRAYEMKFSLAPKPARGFWNAIADLHPMEAQVVYPGDEAWELPEGVRVVPAVRVAEDGGTVADG